MQKKFDCGIDLGTTNSCIAISDGNLEFEIIENQADRMQVTPSAVHINSKGRMLIGQRAYNSQKIEDIAIQFKRGMGTDREYKFKSAGITKNSEELSAEILKVLRTSAEIRTNKRMEDVVITVPAAFKTLQSEATNKAGKIAGFNNVILLQEPIAAAVAYGVRPKTKDNYWMVFDYGGGTLDVAIVSTKNGKLIVENSEGDNFMGGCDIDRLIFENIIRNKIVSEGYRIKHLFDEKTIKGKSLIRKMLLDCENCKIELSTAESSIFELFDLDDDLGRPIEFECEITRKDLEYLIQDNVQQTIKIAKKSLDGANISAEQLDKILLVGGSTYIPYVRECLTHEFGVLLDCSLNPLTVVAAGAAIYASMNTIEVVDKIYENDFAVINLTYDAISSKEIVNVVGKITNIKDVTVSKIKIESSNSADYSGVLWTSGWVDLLDDKNGLFDIDVFLQLGRKNHFRVLACDKEGRNVVIENPYFEIQHNENALKVSAPPATMSIGVQIKDDETGKDVLYHLIKKNTPLPASADKTFRLSRDINPTYMDCITIKIWEGENIINPEANYSAGEITVQSYAMNRMIPKGTEIELTVIADVNRNIRVSGYIPDFDYEIPEETLRLESRMNICDSLTEIYPRIQQSENALQKLKEDGEDVEILEKKLCQLKTSYDKTFDFIAVDDKKVNDFIEDYNCIETEIVQREQNAFSDHGLLGGYRIIAEMKEKVLLWGTANDKLKFNKLEETYKMVQSEYERKYILKKIKELEMDVMFNNYDWLSCVLVLVLGQPETKYTDYQKAAYWIKQGCNALNMHNVQELRDAVIELFKLLVEDVENVISSIGADLMI